MKIKLHFFIVLFLSIVSIYAQDGTQDPTFNPADLGYTNGANSAVTASAIQPDGKVVVCGIFNMYGAHSRRGIVRINANGTIDTTFNPGTGIGDDLSFVRDVAIQSDGKIIIAGNFTSYNDYPVPQIARLNANGSLDTTFNIGFVTGDFTSLCIQPDGKILAGGYFSSINGAPHHRIARLNTNGSVDATFVTGTGFIGDVHDVKLLSDGSIIVAGWFSSYKGINCKNLIKLTANGSIASGFSGTFSGDGTILCIAVSADDKIFIGGTVSVTPGDPFTGVASVNSSGLVNYFSSEGEIGTTRDMVVHSGKLVVVGSKIATFNLDGSNYNPLHPELFSDNHPETVKVFPDNSLFVGGYITYYKSYALDFVMKFNPDLTRDLNFGAGTGMGANNDVRNMHKLANGKIIITGNFDKYNGVLRNRIASITADGLLDTTYNPGQGANEEIQVSAKTPDGRIVIAGKFTRYDGVEVNNMAIINADGTRDAAFIAKAFTSNEPIYFTAITIQPDGKIIVAGIFNAYNGIPCNKICRLNPDGTLDTSFNVTGLPAGDNLYAITHVVLLPGGKMYIAGYHIMQTVQNVLIRANANGSIDTSFTPLANISVEFITDILIDSTGKIIYGGFQPNGSNFPTAVFKRLNTDGTQDFGFQFSGVFPPFSSGVSKLFLQDDGKIILAGSAYTTAGSSEKSMMRVHTNGFIDFTFNFATNYIGGQILCMLPQQDKLIIGGTTGYYNETQKNRISRIYSTGTILATELPEFIDDKLLIYRSGNDLNVTSSTATIARVEVYDIAGRLLKVQKDIRVNNTVLQDIKHDNVLIVRVSLTNGSVQAKKIY
jgi:uncharacterized delta-60 repeat protein